jgi:hypothetical protein
VLIDVNWIAARLTTVSMGAMVAPICVSLPIIVAGAVVGAWMYKE